MASFDASKNWVILVPPGLSGVQKAVEDISRCLGLLRGKLVPLADASGPQPENFPIVVLNAETNGPERNGFSWRVGAERIEIFGESTRGLCNGIYDFLSALGLRWPGPEKETLPSPGPNKVYVLEKSGACEPSKIETQTAPPETPPDALAKMSWKRLVINEKSPALRSAKNREALLAWAARNKFDALICSLRCWTARTGIRAVEALQKQAKDYAISIEAGGWELSLLVPRRLYFFHRDLFRMEGGKRRKKIHFCPTSPETIAALKTEGKKIFGLMKKIEKVQVLHLWPDRGEEKNWCSCPSCRAFTPAEQNRIAVNAAADAWAEAQAETKPGTLISFYEPGSESGSVPLRQNVFRIEMQQVKVEGE